MSTRREDKKSDESRTSAGTAATAATAATGGATSTAATSVTATSTASNPVLPNLEPPSEVEASLYYGAFPSLPRLIGRTSAGVLPWALRVSNPGEPYSIYPMMEMANIGRHRIREVWSDSVEDDVIAALNSNQIPWTSLDVLRIGWNNEHPRERPVVVWVGVESKEATNLEWPTVAKALRACRVVLDEADLADVECELRTSNVIRTRPAHSYKAADARSQGPSQEPLQVPLFNQAESAHFGPSTKPFSTAIGLALVPMEKEDHYGTLCVYVRPDVKRTRAESTATSNTKIWAVTCRHVALPGALHRENQPYEYKGRNTAAPQHQTHPASEGDHSGNKLTRTPLAQKTNKARKPHKFRRGGQKGKRGKGGKRGKKGRSGKKEEKPNNARLKIILGRDSDIATAVTELQDFSFLEDDWATAGLEIQTGGDTGAQRHIHTANAILQTQSLLKQAASRVIGQVALSPPIGPFDRELFGLSRPWTRDWALIELDTARYPAAGLANEVDLRLQHGKRFPTTVNHPRAPSGLASPITGNRPLRLQGTIPLKELANPTTVDRDGEETLLVGLHGAKSGVSWGVALEIMSVTRNCLPDGGSFMTHEWAIRGVKEGSKASVAFSSGGDSGSAVFDVQGRFGGMLTRGASLSGALDISYATPAELLLADIEAHLGMEVVLL